MRKLFLFIATIVLFAVSCTENKKIDSPIMGEYEFGFVNPERIPYGKLIFNSDGTVDGIRNGVGVKEEKIFTFDFDSDSLLILSRSFQGDITETTFVIDSERSDSIFLRMKSKIRRYGADAPGWMKNDVTEVPVVEYDENGDSISVIALLKKI